MKKQIKKPKLVTVDLQERIRRRAYMLWELSGCEHGRDHEHWVQAEREIKQQDNQQGE